MENIALPCWTGSATTAASSFRRTPRLLKASG